MTDHKVLTGYKQQFRFLQVLGLTKPQLSPDDIFAFLEYKDNFVQTIRKGTIHSLTTTVIPNLIRTITHICKQEHGVSFISAVKKCLFLHLFIRRSAITGLFRTEVSETAESALKQIAEIQIPTIIAPPNSRQNKVKKQGSLSKLYHAIRSFSGSAKEQKRSKSKLKLETTKDKGAIKEIIDRIVTPFLNYLLKLCQDPQVYSIIISKKIEKEQWEAYKWKIHNLLNLLGNIILQFNRIGKYFKEELLGCWVFINYCISTDLSIYYRLLVNDMTQRTQKWKQKIQMVLKLYKISKKHNIEIQQIMNDPKLIELKQQIEMILEIKQKILFLYYNTAVYPWNHTMERPFPQAELKEKLEPLEYILDFFLQYSQNSPKKMKKIQSNIENAETERNSSRKIVLTTQSECGPPSRPPRIKQTPLETEHTSKTCVQTRPTLRQNALMSRISASKKNNAEL